MTTKEQIHERYSRLDKASRHVVQVCSISAGPLSRDDITKVSNASGWTKSNGRQLKRADLKPLIAKLVRLEMVGQCPYGGAVIQAAVQDFATQDSVRSDTFSAISKAVEKQLTTRHYRENNSDRDMRIAFYRGDAKAYSNFTSRKSDTSVHVLDPFSLDIFEQLDPLLQELYLVDAVPKMILKPTGSKEMLSAFDLFAANLAAPEPGFLAAWLDLAIARGDLQSLKQLDQRTGRKHREISGCIAFLQGDFVAAEASFASTMSGGKKKGKLAALQHLPAVLYSLVLFKTGSAGSLAEARAIISSVTRSRRSGFAAVFTIINHAISFKQTPSSPNMFASCLRESCDSPLQELIAGYFAKWMLTGDDGSVAVSGLASSARLYSKSGLDWLAAEMAGLAGKSKLKSASAQRKKHKETHANLGTISLIDFVEAEPAWRRSLTAIAHLAGGNSRASADTTASASERMIWELATSSEGISLDAYAQKRKGNGWSKGRKVSRERLYNQHSESEFAFMTDQDHAICKALDSYSERNHYGYSETYYEYDDRRAARALIGHSCVFAPGDRDNPLEVVEKTPQLTVTKGSGGRISLALDPKPHHSEDAFRMIKDGPGRIAMVAFTDQHLKLHTILNGKLTIPASAANEVVQAIQPIADWISVHSEIDVSDEDLPEGTSTTQSQRVDSDSRPHVHLLPFQDGLRAEFYVRPFGKEGPFCKPGLGGATVFAKIGGQPQTAKRDFPTERRLLEKIIGNCPLIDAHADGDAPICLPSPMEALETLIELEKFAEADQIIMHWPKGRSLNLAGQASSSQFHMNIRKDRDWFAASGTLKINKGLEIDMLELIDLVEASPSRFVQMDDGRFLALTERLRQRVKELSAYGDRRSKGNKIRFPKAHAVVLEDLGESCKLKADAHWKKWVQRMRDAGEVSHDVPTTLQTELRDYQEEGFRWLARLAAWGVGGCLADDMGLGKTIQALALLLHRASEGPALVVAPTSVALNWLSEARKFAPTLNAHVFGEGDRAETLDNLGSGDVVICSYGLLHSEAERLQSKAWHTVILDEAQAIKNMATQRSKAAMGLQADFRLIMTGTPLENHLGELWNLMEFINPGMLGGHDSFQNRFALPIERDSCRETRRRLKKLIQPFILRRTKSQVLDELPPRTEVTLKVTLSDEEAAFYEAIRKRAIEKLEEAGSGGSQHLKILAELMRLRRVCCHPRLVLDDCKIAGSKLALFSETIDDLLGNNHKVLVFSQFVDHLTILRELLDSKGVAYQYLDGSTPARARKKSVDAFQAGEGDVFLISLKAGGTGLNLTAADYVIHMDPWWNPAVEDQASDRAHRIGQLRPVTVYRLITEGTIEQRITELHASKRDLADSLLEGTDVSSKLTADQLLKLLRE